MNLPYKLVNLYTALANLIDTITRLPIRLLLLYINFKGVYLLLYGTISILQLFISLEDRTYLINIYTLQDKVFLTTRANRQTLREILELDAILKVLFNVQNNSNTLYSHFEISLTSIQDIQLIELITCTFLKRYVSRLSKYIEIDSSMIISKKQAQ